MTTRASTRALRQLAASVDLPALERAVLARWERDRVFERSLEQTADGDLWMFYEGPPTANGKPGTHHVEARFAMPLRGLYLALVAVALAAALPQRRA